MKKIVITFFFLFFNLCVFAENEIPDTFFGCTLGKSTIDEVQKNLIKRGIATKKTMANLIEDCRVEYDGFVFNSILLQFSGNCLASIHLSYYPDGVFLPSPVNEQKINLCKTVFSKYGSLDKVRNNALDSINEQDGLLWLNERTDNKTTVSFMANKHSIHYIFSNNKLKTQEKLRSEENYNDRNKVDGVAGCKFGDSKTTVKRELNGRSQSLVIDSHNRLMYYDVLVDGIHYKFAEFYFENKNGITQLAAVRFSSSFPAIAHKKATNLFENVTSFYAQMYTNESQTWNFNGSRTYSYGQLTYPDFEIPIMVTLSKGMSYSGSPRYYVNVYYYWQRIPQIHGKEI